MRPFVGRTDFGRGRRSGDGGRPRATERTRSGPGESDTGPADWLVPFLEARYTKLEKRRKVSAAAEKREEEALRRRQEAALARRASMRDADGRLADNGDGGFRSVWQPGRGKEILADLPTTYWLDRMQEYRTRQVIARKRAKARFNDIVDFNRHVHPAPGILGVNNWTPIGPSVVRRGQPTGRPAISGRATGSRSRRAARASTSRRPTGASGGRTTPAGAGTRRWTAST